MGRPAKPKIHGTYTMYNTGRCRCEDCKVAAAEKRAHYRDVHAPKPGDQPKKDYSVRYGSVKVKLSPEPLIEFICSTREVDNILRRDMKMWRRNGLDLYYADKLAIRYGAHPALIWGDDFYQGCEGYAEIGDNNA